MGIDSTRITPSSSDRYLCMGYGMHGPDCNTHWLDLVNLRPLEPPESHDYPPGLYTCTQFFQSLGKDTFTSPCPGFHWEYSLRRQAQRVLPFLYLGPTSMARNIEFLKREGITLVYAIRSRHISHDVIVNADKTAMAAGIESDRINVEDYNELIKMFPDAIRRINNHICCCPEHSSPPGPAEKKVLVFCETGNERSATLIAAYLMVMYNLRLYAALGQVQARRLCVNIDYPVREVLWSFESILQAQRDVSKVSRLPPSSGIYGTNGFKRGHSSIHESEAVQDPGNDHDMDMVDDEHPAKRRNVENTHSNGLLPN
ncbi:hypothetical protein D8B26_005733 [Coccidioides posadasii str. Silveira]|uniref:Tyrosine specific protein phosphatases domain-containing protein n=3 Tax=Coccidioides posadasii TaxID=199306 RepID=E9DAQ7_COCPS|nr:conserved hypothetical protein [Coccidioides posadasii str. Silveira]KMM66928.1 FMI2 protein [Coccidioides posadasii RMSCC 3488]QVM11083.1 hypothetical protein D8B26_005733 [Coccidioides posadasii str. Silveira]